MEELENSANISRFVVFECAESVYAIPAGLVREIVTDLPRFPVPFTPSWVRGVLNRNGEPYTILDIQALLGGQALESQTYLLLNQANDQVALLIGEVREILKLPADSLHTISSSDENSEYFQGIVSAPDGELPCLNIPRLLVRLAQDVSAS